MYRRGSRRAGRVGVAPRPPVAAPAPPRAIPSLRGAAGAVRPWRAPVPPVSPVLARVGPLPPVLGGSRGHLSRGALLAFVRGRRGAVARALPAGARPPPPSRSLWGGGGWVGGFRPPPRPARLRRSVEVGRVSRVGRSRLATHMPVAFSFSGLGNRLQISR